MSMVMQNDDLQVLGQRIQQELRHYLPETIALRIRCAVRQESLLILAEHLLHVEPDPQQTFKALEQILNSLSPEITQSSLSQKGSKSLRALPTRFYLRIAGYQQPYAIHSFTLEPVLPQASPPQAATLTPPPIPTRLPTPASIPPPPRVEPAPAVPEALVPRSPESEPVVEPESLVEPPSSDIAAPVEDAAAVAPIAESPAETILQPEAPLSQSKGPAPVAEPPVEPIVELPVEPPVEPSEPQLAVDSLGAIPETDIALLAEQSEPTDAAVAEPAVEMAQPIAAEIEAAVPSAEIAEPEIIEEGIELAVTEPAAIEPPAAEVAPEQIEAAVGPPVAEVAEVEMPALEIPTLATPEPIVEAIALPDTALEPAKALAESISDTALSPAETEVSIAPEALAEPPEALLPPVEPIAEPTSISPPPEPNAAANLTAIPDSPVAEVELIDPSEVESAVVAEPPETVSAIDSAVPALENLEESTVTATETEASDPIAPLEAPAESVDSIESLAEPEPPVPLPEWSVAATEPETAVAESPLTDAPLPETEPATSTAEPTGDQSPGPDAEAAIAPPTIEQPEAAETLPHQALIEVEAISLPEAASPETEPSVAEEEPLFEETLTVSDESLDETELPGDDLEQIGIELLDRSSEASPPEPPTISIVAEVVAEPPTTISDLRVPTESIPPAAAIETPEPVIEESEPVPAPPAPKGVAETRVEAESSAPPVTESLTEVESLTDSIPDSLLARSSDAAALLNAPHPSPEIEAIAPAEPTLEPPTESRDGSPAPEALPAPEAPPLERQEAPDGATSPTQRDGSGRRVGQLTSAVDVTPFTPAEAIAPEEELAADSTTTEAIPRPRLPRASALTLMLSGAVGLFILFSGWYILSRPCVLSSVCQPLQEAEQLGQTAVQTLQTTSDSRDVVKAHEQLIAANELLVTIPAWSGQHQQAQALLAENRDKTKVLGSVVEALKQANVASLKSQNPPLPVHEWREIQQIWRESIASLEKVPFDNFLYALAERKLKEYRANLNMINQRVIAENEAQAQLDKAKRAAESAEAREGIAISSDPWAVVYAKWQAAVDELGKVPERSMARIEAQRLLPTYQNKLKEVDRRRAQEIVGADAYEQAIALAERAQALEQENQWTEAVSYWEAALESAQKIAPGTAYSDQAQQLITSYTAALDRAEAGQRLSSSIELAKPDLDRACGGAPRICTYTLGPSVIRVQITAEYDRAVEQTVNSAQLRGDETARAEMTSQVNAFLQELAGISEIAQVPIELYNSGGTKFGTYTPNARSNAPSFVPR